ncbi:hypothetical protein AXK57_10875 [Tsukamurella pulmonis]|nr:hypothetical protein AXK57_10875 [Tsukamurella pulmonis]RDH09253.1 hypothetical protein DVB88_24060 [Tsukamurella pulmonis]
MVRSAGSHVVVRGGIGVVGWLAVGALLGCVLFTWRLVSDAVASGFTLPACVSLLLVAGGGARCVLFLRSVLRAGIQWRIAITDDALEYRQGRVQTTLAWHDVESVSYGYEDAGGFPLWHVWTIRRSAGEVDEVRSPAGVRHRPSRVRAAIGRAAPHVQVAGSWRDPVRASGRGPVVESVGRAPEPPKFPTVVRGRYGIMLVIGVLAAVAFGLLAVICLGLSIWPPDDEPALWPGAVIAAASGAVLCAALPVRIIRCGRRIHLWATLEEIGFRTADTDRPGRSTWEHVVAVEYDKDDARGVVYTHRWTISFDDRPPVTVRYPAGASVRPMRFRGLVRDVAPAVRVTGGWW